MYTSMASANNAVNAFPSASRMADLYSKHRTILRRLDDIESCLASRIASHRRRSTNLLEETPQSRRSHVRIFVSHRVEGGNEEEEEEEEKEEKKETNASAAPAPAPSSGGGGRPGGGKDFSALLHSSANQKSAAAAAAAPSSDAAAAAAEAKKPVARKKTKKGVRKWTLVIEGGSLIKHLDHMSAKKVDAKLEAGLPILGSSEDKVAEDEKDPEKDRASSSTTQNVKAEIPLRDQWRGGTSERENEGDVEPIKFTHYFDKMEVEMNVFKKGNKSLNKPSTPEEKAPAVTRSGLGAAQHQNQPPPQEVTPPKPKPDATKSLTWERVPKSSSSSSSSGGNSSGSDAATTPDSHAFFVSHDEESEFKPMGGKVFKSEFNVERIQTRIKLYRRQGEGSENYTPSDKLCRAFFPTFVGKRAAGEPKGKEKSGGKSKKRKRSDRSGGNDALQRSSSYGETEAPHPDASNSSVGSIPAGKEAAFASKISSAAASANAGTGASTSTSPSNSPLEDEKDVHVPNSITMDEALHAIFFYIRTRNLQDATDLSIINNDEVLAELFGCNRMLFSAVRGLLLEKELLTKVAPGTQPIIFNYEMTIDGAEPLTKKRRRLAKSTAAEGEDEIPQQRTRQRSSNTEIDNSPSEPEPPEDIPHQTMLSCDVDVEIPNLFPVRARDLLRRTKYREFEYTSGRIKAIRSLVATKCSEETAKMVMGDVVTGKGYAPHHQRAWMALAKGSHEGGEAQRAAWIDLRTASLLERLEERCSVARGCWDVVEACRNLGEER